MNQDNPNPDNLDVFNLDQIVVNINQITLNQDNTNQDTSNSDDTSNTNQENTSKIDVLDPTYALSRLINIPNGSNQIRLENLALMKNNKQLVEQLSKLTEEHNKLMGLKHEDLMDENINLRNSITSLLNDNQYLKAEVKQLISSINEMTLENTELKLNVNRLTADNNVMVRECSTNSIDYKALTDSYKRLLNLYMLEKNKHSE